MTSYPKKYLHSISIPPSETLSSIGFLDEGKDLFVKMLITFKVCKIFYKRNTE
jgi:hypothetical protein